METIGDRIRNARRNAEFSQQELANLLGVSREAVSNWENNRDLPKGATLIELARITKRSLDWICCLQDIELKGEAAELAQGIVVLPDNARAAIKSTIKAFTPSPKSHAS